MTKNRVMIHETATVEEAPSPDDILHDRIAGAFAEDATFEVVAPVVRAAKEAVREATEAEATARAKALDPTLPRADLPAAREEYQAARFRLERLTEADRRLDLRLEDLRKSELAARARAAREELLQRRQALVVEFAKFYLLHIPDLKDLMKRIVDCDQWITGNNRTGQGWIHPVLQETAPVLGQCLVSLFFGSRDVEMELTRFLTSVKDSLDELKAERAAGEEEAVAA